MAKRRTRAQKQLAVVHRREQFKNVVNPTTGSGLTVSKVESVKKVTLSPPAVIDVVSKQVVEPSFRSVSHHRYDLRRSLFLLVALIAFQLGLWLVFHFSQLDEAIYVWLKV